MRIATLALFAALALPGAAGVFEDIAAAIQQAKEQYAEKQAASAAAGSAVSDAELLRMVRDRYERDMASGSYSKWHGALARQIVVEPQVTNGLAKMVKVFADGFTVTNSFRQATPRTDAERKIIAAKRKAERVKAQIAAYQKQVEEMKSGKPLAVLETRIAALQASLNPATTTNVVTVIGSNAEQQ